MLILSLTSEYGHLENVRWSIEALRLRARLRLLKGGDRLLRCWARIEQKKASELIEALSVLC